MFDDVVGNDRTKELLMKSLNEGTFSHAYLFSGPVGTQKTTTAMAFAQGIFCTSEGSKPCGVCSSCDKISKGNHPDLHIIQPEEDKNSILIQQIRHMQRSISTKPYEGSRKVYILRKAETMGPPAQNAMLRVLEEPEPGTVIIIIANSRSSILPTVLSRCQLVHFAPLSYEAFAQAMEKHHPLSPQALGMLYNLTQGKFGEALSALEDDTAQRHVEQISLMLDKGLQGDLDKIFEITAYASDKHMGEIPLTDGLLIYFRNKMLERMDQNTSEKTEGLTLDLINDIIEKILQFQINSKSNVNMALQVETLLLKIQEAYHDRSRRNTF